MEGQFVDSYDPTIENSKCYIFERSFLNKYILASLKQKMKICLSLLSAFNKMVSVNGQDFNLQLVDTAGQVSSLCIVIKARFF